MDVVHSIVEGQGSGRIRARRERTDPAETVRSEVGGSRQGLVSDMDNYYCLLCTFGVRRDVIKAPAFPRRRCLFPATLISLAHPFIRPVGWDTLETVNIGIFLTSAPTSGRSRAQRPPHLRRAAPPPMATGNHVRGVKAAGCRKNPDRSTCEVTAEACCCPPNFKSVSKFSPSDFPL